MINGFKVITLCGSTRFKDDFIRVQQELALSGNIVLSVDLFSHSDVQIEMTEELYELFDKEHRAKIDLSDAIYVINRGGYIGNSTRSEIEYAKEHNKEIVYME